MTSISRILMNDTARLEINSLINHCCSLDFSANSNSNFSSSLLLWTRTCSAILANQSGYGACDSRNFSFSHFRIAAIISFLLLFLVGLAGNLLIIVCIITFRHMRTASNIFLANLAFSDLLVFLLCEPLSLCNIIFSSWVFDEILCKLQGPLQGITLIVSVSSLMGMNIERFRVINQISRFKRSQLKIRTLLVWVAVIWLMAGIISAPLAFYTELQHSLHAKKFCVEIWSDRIKQVYSMTLCIILYLLPLVVMSILYYLMYQRIRHSTNLSNVSHTNRNQRESLICSRRNRISKVSVALVSIFSISWLPYHAINLYADFQAISNRSSHISFLINHFYPVAQWMVYCNSAINPISILLISAKFKKAFRKITKFEFSQQISTFV